MFTFLNSEIKQGCPATHGRVPWTAGPGTHKHLFHYRCLSMEQRHLITMRITTSLGCLQRRDGARDRGVDKNGSLGRSPNMTTHAYCRTGLEYQQGGNSDGIGIINLNLRIAQRATHSATPKI